MSSSWTDYTIEALPGKNDHNLFLVDKGWLDFLAQETSNDHATNMVANSFHISQRTKYFVAQW